MQVCRVGVLAECVIQVCAAAASVTAVCRVPVTAVCRVRHAGVSRKCAKRVTRVCRASVQNVSPESVSESVCDKCESVSGSVCLCLGVCVCVWECVRQVCRVYRNSRVDRKSMCRKIVCLGRVCRKSMCLGVCVMRVYASAERVSLVCAQWVARV